ncbi:MAG TPA: PqqD family protein [Rhodothermales bacterium]|nr:HPr-rel-A system PqqD family protein [Bacteroidota bacterium]HRK73674.1 PqqD family protein [Rhodothermales bacterium]HRR09909.1 PqqD family protein [Rhodothermales bacterium]
MIINPNVVVREGGFVFHAERGDSFSVNPVGAEILRLLRQGQTVAEVVQELENRYDADVATIEKDVTDFFDVLRHYQILEAS